MATVGTKAVANALFVEFREGDRSYHFLFTPPVVEPGSDRVVPSHMLTRQLSPSKTRTKWKDRQDMNSAELSIPRGAKKIAQSASLNEAMEKAIAQTDRYVALIETTAVSGWTLFKEPVLVEMTEDDTMALATNRTPEALVRRAYKARLGAGYPESLWPVDGQA